ncbi:hypothetical protein [Sporosalibacterium faouarense]|nr:hypothetical protein [Sporosalibacterium faouarense]
MCSKEDKCICPVKDCQYHNECEKCISHHLGKKVPVYCIKETMKRQ